MIMIRYIMFFSNVCHYYMILLICYWLGTVFVSVLKLLLCLRGFHVSNVIVPEMILEFIISVFYTLQYSVNFRKIKN